MVFFKKYIFLVNNSEFFKGFFFRRPSNSLYLYFLLFFFFEKNCFKTPSDRKIIKTRTVYLKKKIFKYHCGQFTHWFYENIFESTAKAVKMNFSRSSLRATIIMHFLNPFSSTPLEIALNVYRQKFYSGNKDGVY